MLFRSACAWNAALSLRYLDSLTKRHVVTHVECEQVGKGVKVYNLTLENENAYYANGVLVQNCSDSGFMALFMARKLGLVSDEKAAPVVRKQMPGMDLSFLTRKNAPSIPTERMIDYGGGWSYG